jgi:hypothetical protein
MLSSPAPAAVQRAAARGTYARKMPTKQVRRATAPLLAAPLSRAALTAKPPLRVLLRRGARRRHHLPPMPTIRWARRARRSTASSQRRSSRARPSEPWHSRRRHTRQRRRRESGARSHSHAPAATSRRQSGAVSRLDVSRRSKPRARYSVSARRARHSAPLAGP